MKKFEVIQFMKNNPHLTASEIGEKVERSSKYVTHIACIHNIKIAVEKQVYNLTCCNGNGFILQCFKGMHDRVRDGKCPSIEWERNQSGFEKFVKEIGDITIDMTRPSVGRKNHSIGYQSGNIMWEDFKQNSGKHRGSKNESDFIKLHP